MKIRWYDLMVEVTRRCNMRCAHCLRGEAEWVDMSKETVDALLDITESIDTITFGGGEPSLNYELIDYFVDECKQRDIPIYGYYVVTNGKVVPDGFLMSLIKLHAYVVDCAGETDICGICLSKDMFHESILKENEYKLRAFSSFREDKETDFSRDHAIINLGRARSLDAFVKREPLHNRDIKVEICNDIISIESDDCLSITVNGDILNACDYEYCNTEHLKIGNIFNPNLVEKLTELAKEESGKKISTENAEIWLIEHKAEFLNRMGVLSYEILKAMLKEENNHGTE